MSNCESQSGSDNDDFCDGFWSLNKRKKLVKIAKNESKSATTHKIADSTVHFDWEKFKQLKEKSAEISVGSATRRQKTESRRTEKLLKKALKDPWIKAAVDGVPLEEGSKTFIKDVTWKDVKPFLSVNDHLAGPISHGHCGPKTELENTIDGCIKEGDFEKAELLSDTLANREFAVKIAHAFEAKKYHEHIRKQKEEVKQKQLKKIHWTFEAKERWQMKGNM